MVTKMSSPDPLEDPGRYIYERRASGLMWMLAGAHTQLSLKQGLLAARDYARENDLPWPPLQREQRRVEEFVGTEFLRRLVTLLFVPKATGPKLLEQGSEEAFLLRGKGQTWTTIGKTLDCRPDAVRKAAVRYAKDHDLPPPAKKVKVRRLKGASYDRGRVAYRDRLLLQDPWERIAVRIGYNPFYKSGYLAAKAARRFARKHDLPWPIPLGGAVIPEDDIRRCAYYYRESGLPWEAIRILVGATWWEDVKNLATLYALEKGLPPPRVSDGG